MIVLQAGAILLVPCRRSRMAALETPRTDRRVFGFSIGILLAVVAPLMVWPEASGRVLDAAYGFISERLGVVYLWAGLGVLVFVLWLALGRHGNVKLGAPDSQPRFSLFSWISMLFCAGVATGILYWGTIEWAAYFEAPPYGVEPRSNEAAEWASTYGIFHWGFTGWAFYALPALAIGYAYYVRRIPYLRVSAACERLLGEGATKWPGKVMDVLFMVGLLGATGTSLGFGTPMIAAGVSLLLGVEDTFSLRLIVMALCTTLFSVSVYLGLERGIKRLSDINILLTKAILLYVLIAGPTLFILKMATNSIGFMAVNYVRMSTWTDPLTDSGFVEDWTVFYWAWWVAVGPFMGIFVARISEGRTIRQIVLGMLSLGTLGSAVYYSILGNYALFLELEGLLPVTQIVAEQGEPAAIVQVVASLPMGTVLLAVFCVASLVFLATTYDSASYTLASSTTESLQGEQEPARWLRLFWAVVLGILPIALMQIGGLEPLKTASLVASLPLLAVFLLMGISLWLSLRDDRPPGTGGL